MNRPSAKIDLVETVARIPALAATCSQIVQIAEAHHRGVLWSYFTGPVWQSAKGQLLETLDDRIAALQRALEREPRPELLGILLTMVKHREICARCEEKNTGRREKGLSFECEAVVSHAKNGAEMRLLPVCTESGLRDVAPGVAPSAALPSSRIRGLLSAGPLASNGKLSRPRALETRSTDRRQFGASPRKP